MKFKINNLSWTAAIPVAPFPDILTTELGFMSPFSILLHEFRLRCNLRQSDLAERLGYEQSYLSSLEVGRKGRPTREFVLKLVEALNLYI
ncbi:helix-turn-helix protein [Paraburkholderia silvatlantica]|uniref:Helix-turn-helix protein n=1 Tax=Paraburkholderia silvatlantica TaxID=321895 RepID=A0A2V4UQF3_9BURK|nr:helix-turn-helix protein [Paraburkholderia silvatlantica]